MKCKGAVDNVINNSEGQNIGADAKIHKNNDQAVKELSVVKKILEKPKVDDLKPGPLEKLVEKSAKLCRKHSELLDA